MGRLRMKAAPNADTSSSRATSFHDTFRSTRTSMRVGSASEYRCTRRSSFSDTFVDMQNCGIRGLFGRLLDPLKRSIFKQLANFRKGLERLPDGRPTGKIMITPSERFFQTFLVPHDAGYTP